MGYTNYWYQHEDFTNDEWNKIKVFYHGLKMVHGGGEYNEANHIFNDEKSGDHNIVFNGTKGQDYETFVLNKFKQDIAYYDGENTSFHFCKTARNPYDAIVWAVLSYARYVKGDRSKFVVTNDDGEHYGKE